MALDKRLCGLEDANVKSRSSRLVDGSMNGTIHHFLQMLQAELPLLSERYGVASLGLFGSYLHGTQRPDSDLDILVSFSEMPSLLRFLELENYLSDRLGVKVDLVLREALKPHIGERVLREVVPV